MNASNNNQLRQLVGSNRDLEEAVRFHGHMCPGLAIGYRASRAAIERLLASRAGDEELVTIVENDSCSVDAVQWMTGCTFGKGNLIFRDHGKQVFTFIARSDGQAVRIAFKPHSLPVDQDRDVGTCHVLTAPIEELFDVREVTVAVPQLARIHDTLVCEFCGEGVMATRAVMRSGCTLCMPCAQEEQGK